MTPLTYEILVTCRPLFHVDILAGWGGKKGICQHVYLNELPSEENSLVLISDDTISLLAEAVKDNNCTGILILSTQSCDLLLSITDFANKRGKPIFSLSNFGGEDLHKRINEIFHLHEQKILPLMKSDLTTYWIELLSQDGIEYIIERLTMFLGQEVFLFSNKKDCVPLLATNYTTIDFKNLKRIDSTLGQEHFSIFIVHNEKEEFYSFEISHPSDHVKAYLLWKKRHPIEDLPGYLLETTIPMFNFWFKQIELTRDVHLKYKDQFLFDILHNNIDTERELIELGRVRNIEFTANIFVLSMNLNGHQTITKEIIMNIQQLLVENSVDEINIYTTYLSHRIVGIVCPTTEFAEISKNQLNDWISNVQILIHDKYPNLQTLVGVGRKYNSILEIYKSFQESKIALQMESHSLDPDGIIYYEDLGFVRLLSYIHNDLLKDFSRQYLSELEKYDAENETELIHTLTIYCAKDGNIPLTADDLFIHQNTLRQRLKKIESILDMDLNSYTNLVNIILSLQISKDTNVY